MLSVVMLNVVMPIVLAPLNGNKLFLGTAEICQLFIQQQKNQKLK
jgi:hypothetical protein